jgi:hypothetical protein
LARHGIDQPVGLRKRKLPGAHRTLLSAGSIFGLALAIVIAQACSAEAPRNEQPAAPSPNSESSSAQTAQPLAQVLVPQTNPQKAQKPLDSCAFQNTGATLANTGALRAIASAGIHAAPRAAGEQAVTTTVCVDHAQFINWYARFTTGPDVKPMSVEEKARLAVVNVTDPFNLMTIFGLAAVSIASNSHTVYGPGFHGWAEYSGVTFTQDMTGQFIGTFLIPSVTHTDPHYHRRPDLSIPRRILHCVDQIVWQRADNRKETLNYSELFGPIADIAISNLYVPGQQTHFAADAERYGVGLATAPIDNFITEFLPSIASHFHTHVVLVQRIINRVAYTGPGT